MRVLQYASFGGPEVLQVVERPMPEPGAGDVVVRVHAATVGIGDCKARAGLLRHLIDVPLPKSPGRYGVGVIAAAGRDAGAHRVGDAVVFSTLHSDGGSAADYVRVGAGQIAARPANLSDIETAACIQGAVSAYACLAETAQLAPGARVLIHGAAGSVGSACVELAHHLGASVTAHCRSSDEDFVRALGADEVVFFDRQDFADGVRGQDVVVDLIGGDVHRRSYDVLRPGGRLIYMNAAPIEKQDRAGVQVLQASVSSNSATLEPVCRLIERGVFAPRLGKALPLEAGAEAHRLIETGAAKRGRIVLQLA